MVDSILEWASLISATVGCMATLLLVVIEITNRGVKKACLDEIERINALEEADKPKPPVILRGEMYKAEHIEYHETVKDAALSACWAITDNTFMPCQIEHEGKIVWKNGLLTNDEYPTLVSLAGMEDDQK